MLTENTQKCIIMFNLKSGDSILKSGNKMWGF